MGHWAGSKLRGISFGCILCQTNDVYNFHEFHTTFALIKDTCAVKYKKNRKTNFPES